MHAPAKADDPIATPQTLTEYDGIAFGFPTRYGVSLISFNASLIVSYLSFFSPQTPAAQMKSYWDSTGQLWQAGSLVGKPVTAFTSTGSLQGGQETTILASVPFYVHHGMIFVPPGYSYGAPMFNVTEVRGGSPWGAGTFAAGDGSRQPTEAELGYAKHQGTYFSGVVGKLAVKKE